MYMATQIEERIKQLLDAIKEFEAFLDKDPNARRIESEMNDFQEKVRKITGGHPLINNMNLEIRMGQSGNMLNVAREILSELREVERQEPGKEKKSDIVRMPGRPIFH